MMQVLAAHTPWHRLPYHPAHQHTEAAFWKLQQLPPGSVPTTLHSLPTHAAARHPLAPSGLPLRGARCAGGAGNGQRKRRAGRGRVCS